MKTERSSVLTNYMVNNKTAQLLISGGDERLVLNKHGLNKYGCLPMPNDTILSFSSSTASTISNESFSVAKALQIRLEKELQTTSAEFLYFQEINRQKSQWFELLGLTNNIQLIFSPSGTDLHALVANQVADDTLIIMVEGNETGSGVKSALGQGRGIKIISIPLRLTDGLPRPLSTIDSDVVAHVQKGIEQQREVLLILIDQSKTGMIAPSPQCALQLKARFSTQFNVLVDACQFRLSATTLKAYLQHNFMVALTGSKFLAAPSFSAVLLMPNVFEFSEKSKSVNWGLLLRMEVALAEYRQFQTLTNTQISKIIGNFADAVQTYLVESPYFETLLVPKLNRQNLVKTPMWDELPTIFPFVLLRDNKLLSRVQTAMCYQQLPLQNPACQIGQPVSCGQRDGVEISALRLCLSSRLIVQAAQSQACLRDCIEKALLVLATLETLIQSDLPQKMT